MRTHGHLSKWNDDRGFGFISVGQGADEVFVHVSAFPRGGRPQVGELLSFEVRVVDGKRRALDVQRPSSSPRRSRKAGETGPSSPVRRVAGVAAVVAILLAIAGYTYQRLDPRAGAFDDRPAVMPSAAEPMASSSSFQCDGRTQCSQMRSCAEAEFFLKNCPNTTMDGNNDGEPCEQQCASSDFSH